MLTMNRVGCLGCGCDERSAVDVAALAQAQHQHAIPGLRFGKSPACRPTASATARGYGVLHVHLPGMTAGLAYTPNMVYIFKIKIKNVN